MKDSYFPTRAAILRSGQEITRDKLDCGISRDYFWVRSVAHFFNDTTIRPMLQFSGPSHEVKSSLPPSRAITGEELKRQYSNVWSDFKKVYDKFSKSGQNSP